MRNFNKQKEKALLQESNDWETRKRGADSRALSSEEENKVEADLHLQMISLRLPVEWIEDLKREAATKGMKYQPYIRQILGDHRQRGPLEERVAKLENSLLKRAVR